MSKPYPEQESEMPRNKARAKEKTVVMEEGSTAELPKAVRRAGAVRTHLSATGLECLYEITKLLVNFEDPEKTLAAVLASVSNTLPLRSAVLIDESATRAHVYTWKAEDEEDEAIQKARNHATASYAYLARSRSISQTHANLDRKETGDVRLDRTAKADENFIVMPLVAHRSIYGVLQVECRNRFDEFDVALVNVVANQFAIALDRHKARQREVAARIEAEGAEQRMAFLAESRRMLSSSLDYLATWESIANLAVSRNADICVIDIVGSVRWSAGRICVLAPAMSENVTEQEAANAVADVMSKVLETGEALILPDRLPPMESNAARSERCHAIAGGFAIPVKSCACVPLTFEGSTIGTLTVARTQSATIYSDADVSVLIDLGISVVLAFNRARLYQTAVEAIRGRDDLLGIVAHDLRAPLSVIMGFTSIFLESARENELVSCNRAHIQAIHRSATNMNRLIEDLLSTASIEARHLVIERHFNSVGPLIDEALERMQPLASQKGIVFKREPPDYISPIFVDRERIMQVFANLIHNAIKFAPKGSIVTVRADHMENEVQFSIEDAGAGIPVDQLAHVFDRFRQVPDTARKGTGLGLFIVKGVVEAHGGRVWAERNVGPGTTLRFTLPTGPSVEINSSANPSAA